MSIPFSQRLADAVGRTRAPVVVGLDPRRQSLPPALAPGADASLETIADCYERFCAGVIDVVAPLVPAVKPQSAFFEQLGPAGASALVRVIAHARRRGLLVILDVKRGDIGSTAEAYADAYLGPDPLRLLAADAVTVSPYLGGDSLEPFVATAQQRGAGLFILVKTSNPGSGQLQDLVADGQPVYRHVAGLVEQLAAASA